MTYFKGYWQVPLLADRARDISAFVTPNNLSQDMKNVGMKNAPSTFQRMINALTASLKGSVVYIVVVVINDESFDEHVQRINASFHTLSDTSLTVNLARNELGCA